MLNHRVPVRRRLLAAAGTLAAALLIGACGGDGAGATSTPGTTTPTPATTTLPSGLSGTIAVDGSSTVFPITEAVAEEFRKVAPQVRTTVGISGTGGGFKRFCTGETDIANASRPIKDSEKEACQKARVENLELKVALDGLAVVVNASNTFVDYLTVTELKRIWEPGSQIARWSQVRANWPNEPIALFGPGTASGTFDYFTEVINGKEDASRSDYAASEDDNVLVQGVAGDRYSLGYFGFAYYAENKAKLRAVPIDPGDGQPVMPSEETVESGEYRPLSRPLFIYVNKKSLAAPHVREFVSFYLREAAGLATEVGYMPLPQTEYDKGLASLRAMA